MAKKFAVFDIDGTLIRWQMVHAVFDQLGRGNHLAPGDYDVLLNARRAWKTRATEESFMEYEMEVIGVIQRNLKHIAVPDFSEAVAAVFAEYKDQVYRYTRDLIRILKKQDYFLLAISGSPEEIVSLVTNYYGFDDFVGTQHLQKDGAFTGEIMVAALHKPALLQKLVARNHLSFAGSIGVGDSEGDIGMLALTAQPIAFNPSKKLFAHAKQAGWQVVVERKNMIYELEAANGSYKLAGTNA